MAKRIRGGKGWLVDSPAVGAGLLPQPCGDKLRPAEPPHSDDPLAMTLFWRRLPGNPRWSRRTAPRRRHRPAESPAVLLVGVRRIYHQRRHGHCMA